MDYNYVSQNERDVDVAMMIKRGLTTRDVEQGKKNKGLEIELKVSRP